MTAREDLMTKTVIAEMVAAGIVERDNDAVVVHDGDHTYMVEVKALDVTNAGENT